MDNKGLVMNTLSMREKADPPSNELDSIIGRIVQDEINVQGLKKYKVAEDAGLENGYFSELMHGKKRWNTDAILSVSRALRKQPFELLGGQSLTPGKVKILEKMGELLALQNEAVDLQGMIDDIKPSKNKSKPPKNKKPKPDK